MALGIDRPAKPFFRRPRKVAARRHPPTPVLSVPWDMLVGMRPISSDLRFARIHFMYVEGGICWENVTIFLYISMAEAFQRAESIVNSLILGRLRVLRATRFPAYEAQPFPSQTLGK